MGITHRRKRFIGKFFSNAFKCWLVNLQRLGQNFKFYRPLFIADQSAIKKGVLK